MSFYYLGLDTKVASLMHIMGTAEFSVRKNIQFALNAQFNEALQFQ